MQRDKIKVVIAGQSPIIRLGLVHTLYNETEVTVVREIAGLFDVLQVLTSIKPDVAVIENSFAKWEVVDLLQRLGATSSVPILILAEGADQSYADSVLRAGARGLMLTSEPLGLLVPALRKVINGGAFLSESLRQENKEASAGRVSGGQFGIHKLSDRELQVFELMGTGYDTKEIGEKLHIGTKTVESHRRHIKQKLDFNNTSELLRSAISWVVQTRRQLVSS